MHSLELLGALTFVWMMMSRKSQKYTDMFCCDVDKGAANKREILWVVCVAGVSGDGVVTVAASIIFSLLLISGDVEMNPGPGMIRGLFVILDMPPLMSCRS